MTAHADPLWTLILWVLIGSLLLAILAVRVLRWADTEVERHVQAALADEAADHDEPTREQVEWEMHVAEAIALTQADIDALIAWDELEFMSAVLADIDELPGGAS